MNSSSFRALLAEAGLRQTDLIALAGLSLTAINRYCSSRAADRKPVPRAVVALVVAWSLLNERQRVTMRVKLENIDGRLYVVIWCFQRQWAVQAPDGSIGGWTDEVGSAGRWERDQVPEEFGTILVEDPHWPVPPGIAAIHPLPPERPKPARKRKRRTMSS